MRYRVASILMAVALILIGAAAARAQTLQQLSDQTRQVYQQVRGGIVRLQLPAPRYLSELAARENPAHKWGGMLDPEVRRRLLELQQQATAGGFAPLGAAVAPATQPTTAPSTAPGESLRITVLPDGRLLFEAQGQEAPAAVAPPFAPNNVGLIIDEQGHVLVPQFVEKETVADRSLAVMTGDGQVTAASFVGSDRQTNITILQLRQTPGARPLRLAECAPEDGSLVLLFSPSTGTGRLLLWTGGQQDYGVVVLADGQVAGFARYGQFLSAALCQPLVRQIIDHGQVIRPTLGLHVREIRADEPLRQLLASLGTRPALRVEAVSAHSLAAEAGLRPGDIIYTLNNTPVGDIPTFAAVMGANPPTAELRLFRGQQDLTVSIPLPQP